MRKNKHAGAAPHHSHSATGVSGPTSTTTTATATHPDEADMYSHPDVIEMRQRFDRVAGERGGSMVDGLLILLGVYMAISPWVVHFHTTNPELAVNNLLIGITLAVFGFGLALRPGFLHGLGWMCVPIGTWMIISPWVVTVGHHATRGIIWNNAFTGGLTVLLGLAALGVLFMAGRGESRKSRRAERTTTRTRTTRADQSRAAQSEQMRASQSQQTGSGQPGTGQRY